MSMRNILVRTRPGSGRRKRLRGRWQQHSQEAGWQFPDDWLVPEVQDVVEAGLSGGAFQAAVKRLGAARAYRGVGVREAMVDLSALFRAAKVPADEETMRDLVEGWITESARCEPFSCTDVRTGLVTMAHFERLLYELSLASDTDRRDTTIATLRVDWVDPRLPSGWELLAKIGQIVLQELAPLGATATLHRTSIHVLIAKTDESVAALRRCVVLLGLLDERRRGASFAGFTAPPSSPAAYIVTAAQLAGSD